MVMHTLYGNSTTVPWELLTEARAAAGPQLVTTRWLVRRLLGEPIADAAVEDLARAGEMVACLLETAQIAAVDEPATPLDNSNDAAADELITYLARVDAGSTLRLGHPDPGHYVSRLPRDLMR